MQSNVFEPLFQSAKSYETKPTIERAKLSIMVSNVMRKFTKSSSSPSKKLSSIENKLLMASMRKV